MFPASGVKVKEEEKISEIRLEILKENYEILENDYESLKQRFKDIEDIHKITTLQLEKRISVLEIENKARMNDFITLNKQLLIKKAKEKEEFQHKTDQLEKKLDMVESKYSSIKTLYDEDKSLSNEAMEMERNVVNKSSLNAMVISDDSEAEDDNLCRETNKKRQCFDNKNQEQPKKMEGNQFMEFLVRGEGSTPRSGGRRGSSGCGGFNSHSHPIPATPGFGSSSHDSMGHRTPSPQIQYSPSAAPIPDPNAVQGDRTLYFQLIRNILNEPGHHLLPTLHPHKLPNTYWFDYDSSVATSIKDIFEKDFKEPYTGCKNIPEYVFDRWFITFARKYHWERGITSVVRKEFDKKIKQRLPDMVGRWKKSWEKKGEEGLHHWFSSTVRKSLIAFWQREDHQNRSNNSKDTRSTSGSRCTHHSGRTSFVARRRRLAKEKGESQTDLLNDLAYTKRKPDGSFVDADSESLYNQANSRLHEMTQNEDPKSTTSGGLSIALKNKVFLQIAPRRRGKIMGIGSIQSQIDTSDFFPGTSSNPRLLGRNLI